MALRIETADPILQIALGIGAATFLVAFVLAVYFSVLVLARTGALIEPAEDRQVGRGERLGRKNRRFNAFLVRPEFRRLRRMYFSAWGLALAAFLYLAVLTAIFERAR